MPDEIIIDHTKPPADDHSLHIDHTPRPAKDTRKSNSVHNPRPSQSPEDNRKARQLSPLQTVVQINVYRERGGQFEFLLLKRIDHDDKFWQPVTQPVPISGTIAETLRQSAAEQIGIRGFKHLSHEMHSYEWYAHGERGRDIVFAAELSVTAVITPDTSRFSACQWFNVEQTILHLKWNGNKDAIRSLSRHLGTYRRAHPLPLTTGLYETSGQPTKLSTLPAATIDDSAANVPQGRPQHPNSQRLPDLPSSSTNDTSALFL